MMAKRLLWAFVLLQLTMESCDRRGATHGFKGIQVSTGKRLYFKREVRGRNFDEWTISLNPDPCAEFDGLVDAQFQEVGPLGFYYRVDADRVELIGTPGLTMPKSADLLGLLHYEQLRPLDYRALEENWEERHLKPLDIPVDRSIVCF